MTEQEKSRVRYLRYAKKHGIRVGHRGRPRLTQEQKEQRKEQRKEKQRQYYHQNREIRLAYQNAYARRHRTGFFKWRERRPAVLSLAQGICKAFSLLEESARSRYALKLLASERSLVKRALGVPSVDYNWIGEYSGI